MKLLNIIIVTFLLLTTFACSSTKTVKVEKKPLISDHYLMMSLLNRPMTGDQKLMLAFAQQQDEYQQEAMPIFVNAVMITGEKSTRRNQNIYTDLIAKDINAIRISGTF